MLTGVAIGEPYESHLTEMAKSAAAAGFDRTLLWTRKELLLDPVLRHRFDWAQPFNHRLHRNTTFAAAFGWMANRWKRSAPSRAERSNRREQIESM